jgi:hypothetical protein
VLSDNGEIEYTEQTEEKLVRVRVICCGCNKNIEKDQYQVDILEPSFSYYQLHATWGYNSDFDNSTWDAWICDECFASGTNKILSGNGLYSYVGTQEQVLRGATFFPEGNISDKDKYAADDAWDSVLKTLKIPPPDRIDFAFYVTTDRSSYKEQKYMNELQYYEESKWLNNATNHHENFWIHLAKTKTPINKVIDAIKAYVTERNQTRCELTGAPYEEPIYEAFAEPKINENTDANDTI